VQWSADKLYTNHNCSPNSNPSSYYDCSTDNYSCPYYNRSTNNRYTNNNCCTNNNPSPSDYYNEEEW